MILVTGATGMTRQFVVRELLYRGHAVHALARETSADRVPTPARRSPPAIWATLPACTAPLRASSARPHRLHLHRRYAGRGGDGRAAGHLGDSPFVFISSLDVYGHSQQIPVTEEHPLVESAG